MSVCASCTSFSIDSPIISSSDKKPSWLQDHDYVQHFIDNIKTFSEKKQNKYDQIIDLSLGKKHANKIVLYWATKYSSDLIVNDAKTAYGTFKNHGIVKLNNYGKGKLYLQCPQIYKTKQKGSSKEESFFRHFHFVFSNKDSKSWLPKIYTHLIICKRNLQYVKQKLKTSSAVLLNALPSEYYAKNHIPNSYNMNYKTLQKMSPTDFKKWLTEVIHLHYPSISKLLSSKKISIEDVPIISYCAHESCNASELLEKELLKRGMHRVDSFPGGMKDWSK